ncbi:putative ATP-dependent RNA helicase DDX60-like [Saguinus oedipus]|uniref:ATP-dependent RNA helicase DDX60-like n=1 Tax=Saguinus oedipus TaxID=9490 RepID=A0ABQ9W139_SAGOE|nr:putative ATP-dependent RNA helicase DDX60-like [Saguinus oedipus]
MTSAVIDEFVGDVVKDLPVLKSDDPVVPSLFPQKTSDELLHWHGQRLLSDDYDRIKCHIDEKSRDPHVLDFLKNCQAYQQFYGKSLEAVSTKVISIQTTQQKDSSGASGEILQNIKTQKVTKKKKKNSIPKEDQNKEQQNDDLVFSIEEEMKNNLHSGIRKLEDFLTSCAKE